MPDLQDPLIVACAKVLAGKGSVGLVERVDIGVNEVFHAAGSGTARHQDRIVKGVDGGLDGDVGQGEQDPLETGGNAHLHDLLELHGVDFQLFQF